MYLEYHCQYPSSIKTSLIQIYPAMIIKFKSRSKVQINNVPILLVLDSYIKKRPNSNTGSTKGAFNPFGKISF